MKLQHFLSFLFGQYQVMMGEKGRVVETSSCCMYVCVCLTLDTINASLYQGFSVERVIFLDI